MRLAVVDGERIEAQPGLRGSCPGCGGEVYAKCGEVMVWHWAHATAECDSWTEPESEWHLDWKSRFPLEYQEAVLGEHRADVKGPLSVLEVQRSSISTEAVREREEFYGQMIWVLNTEGFADRFSVWYAGGGVYQFMWKMPRKTWAVARRPIVLDLPYGLLLITKLQSECTPWTGEGRFLSSNDLFEMVCGPEQEPVDHPWHEVQGVLTGRRQRMERVCRELLQVSDAWYEGIRPEFARRFLASRGINRRPRWLDCITEGQIALQVKRRVDDAEREGQEWTELLQEALEFQRQEIQREKDLEARRMRDRARAAWQSADQRRVAQMEAEEREQQRLLQERQWQAEAEAARRRSWEEFEALQLQRIEEAARQERLARARELAARMLAQASLLEMEWRRPEIIEEFLAWREAPVAGLGQFETPFIQACVKSLQAAGRRGHITRR
jgi:hypothetical protein